MQARVIWAWVGICFTMGPVMLKYMVMANCLDGIYTQLNLLCCPWYLHARVVENEVDFFLRRGLADKTVLNTVDASEKLLFGIFVVTHGWDNFQQAMASSNNIMMSWGKIQQLVKDKRFVDGQNQPLKGNALLDVWLQTISAGMNDENEYKAGTMFLIKGLKEINTKGDDESIWWRYMPQLLMADVDAVVKDSPSKAIPQGQNAEVAIDATWKCDSPIVIHFKKPTGYTCDGKYGDHLLHYPQVFQHGNVEYSKLGMMLATIHRTADVASVKRRDAGAQNKVGAVQNQVVGFIFNIYH